MRRRRSRLPLIIPALVWRLGRHHPGLALLLLIVGSGWYAYEVKYARPQMAYLGVPVAVDWKSPLTWTRVLRNAGFMVGYSELRGDPLWVIYKLSQPPGQGAHRPRPPRFVTDGRSVTRISHDDYDRSGYDRGHLAPNHALSLLYGRAGQFDTFLMTNIVPQKPDLNRGLWERMEEAELDILARRFSRLWVVTGPVFEGRAERLASAFRVEVPDQCYKIYVVPETGKAPEMLALMVPQRVLGHEPLDRFVTTVDDVERRTGLNFFPQLDRRFEKAAEGPPNLAFWRLAEWSRHAGRYAQRAGHYRKTAAK